VIAVAVYARQKKLGLKQVGDAMGSPLEVAGVIILITAAGGAYGAMIRNAGIGDAVKALAGGDSVNYVLLAWVLSVVVRVAQGSATVAMITASSIVMSIAGAQGFDIHPFYVFLAVGYGAMFFSWMNDSGFWVVSRLGGLTESETLRSWSVLLTVISVVGLLQTLLVAAVWPTMAF
jgi:GntP family gluconate:H+ symporter